MTCGELGALLLPIGERVGVRGVRIRWFVTLTPTLSQWERESRGVCGKAIC
jgi:hypothetical protein